MVILLDLRYHSHEQGPESDLLGDEQWRWLGNELKGSKKDVVLLGSSFQMLSSEHPHDHWGH